MGDQEQPIFDWKKNQSLMQTNEHMVNNQFLADIRFLFDEDKIIYAHSFELAKRSQPFYESYKATIGILKSIPVRDVSHDIFLEFLRFIYTDKCRITSETALELLKLSMKYCVFALQKQSSNVIVNSINLETVCGLLQMSIADNYDSLKSHALKFIASKYADVISHETFFHVDENTLKAVLKLDHIMNCQELNIFSAASKWASYACLRDGLTPNASLKRLKLGENIKLIRFATMTAEEFGKCTAIETGMLSSEEISAIFLNITAKQKNEMGFSDVKRQFITKTPVPTTESKPLNDGNKQSNSKNKSENKPNSRSQSKTRAAKPDCAIEPKSASSRQKGDAKNNSILININRHAKSSMGFPLTTSFGIKFTVSIPLELIGVVIHCPNGLIRLAVGMETNQPVATKQAPCTEGSFTLRLDRPVVLEPSRRYDIAYHFIGAQGYLPGYATTPQTPYTIKNSGCEFTFVILSQNVERLIFNKA